MACDCEVLSPVAEPCPNELTGHPEYSLPSALFHFSCSVDGSKAAQILHLPTHRALAFPRKLDYMCRAVCSLLSTSAALLHPALHRNSS
jgi:hypothetical protein